MTSARKVKSHRVKEVRTIEHVVVLDEAGVWREFVGGTGFVQVSVKSRLWYDGRRAAATVLGVSEQDVTWTGGERP